MRNLPNRKYPCVAEAVYTYQHTPQWPRPPALTGFNVGTTLRNLDLRCMLSNTSCAIVVTPQKQTELRLEKNKKFVTNE